MNEWVKLEKRSDWGVTYYAFPGEGYTEFNTACQTLGLKFKHGDEITCRFPNGHKEKLRIKIKSIEDKVYDSGHYYDVAYNLPILIINVHGLEIDINLDQIEVNRQEMETRKP